MRICKTTGLECIRCNPGACDHAEEVKNTIIRESEAIAVKKLGEQIGYGNLMEWASALWRKDLKDKGYPVSGAFVPKIAELSSEQELYDAKVTILFS